VDTSCSENAWIAPARARALTSHISRKSSQYIPKTLTVSENPENIVDGLIKWAMYYTQDRVHRWKHHWFCQNSVPYPVLRRQNSILHRHTENKITGICDRVLY
jgi:hypothetical protein